MGVKQPAGRVVGHFGNGKLTPSPVACPERSRRAPATGRLCRLSTRRQVPAYPAYRRQAQAGRRAQRQVNIANPAHDALTENS